MNGRLDGLREALIEWLGENGEYSLHRVSTETGIRYATLHGFYYGQCGMYGEAALALEAFLYGEDE